MPAPSMEIPLLDLPDAGPSRGLGVVESTDRKIRLPLSSVDVQARVAERIAHVCVKQVFENSLSEPMEAIYIFPLAAGCAVSKFSMRVAERVIEGRIQERSEARRAYQQALTNGNRAALMEQERDDVFTVQVGNLPPGEQVTVEISYSERLPFYDNGRIELRLPTVVAPRYIAGSSLNQQATGFGVDDDTDLVPDASRISPPRLVAGNDARTGLTISVEMFSDDDHSQLTDLECSQHAVKMSLKPGSLRINLADTSERLNRDFVLRWRMSDSRVKTTLLTYTDESGTTYGALSVIPPEKTGFMGAPRDVLFLVDRSGSMEGLKMSSAIRACSMLLNTLGPNDRFGILAFDDRTEWMPQNNGGNLFVRADEEGIHRGDAFLRSIDSRGGTELERALSCAIQSGASRQGRVGRTCAIVVITDGEVGGESQILARIQRDLADIRLFAVGIDTAVNAGLLKRMANLGGGTAAFVEPGIQLEEALLSIGREIGDPLVTDLQVDGLDLTIDRASISPSRIPDLFERRASLVFFQLRGHGQVRVSGNMVDGRRFEAVVSPRSVRLPAIAQLWAKARIVELEDQFRLESKRGSWQPGAADTTKGEIVSLSIRHGLLTRFTAFVAVDVAEVVNEGGRNRTLVQPAEQPAHWSQFAQQPAAPGSILSEPAPADTSVRCGSMGNWFGNESDEAKNAPQSAGDLNGQWRYASRTASAESSEHNAPRMKKGDSCKEESAPDKLQSSCAPPVPAPSSRSEACAPPPPPVCEVEQHKRGIVPSQKADIRRDSADPYGLNKLGDKLANLEMEAASQRHLDSCSTGEPEEYNPIEQFIETLDKSFSLIESGNRPCVDALEASRQQLLQYLSTISDSFAFPLLQKFVRSTAIDLIASLRDNHCSLQSLQDFWRARSKEFQAIFAEVSAQLPGVKCANQGASQDTNFWESTI